ncbi:MAG: hypothetical protein U1C04_07550 [Hydrogenophaga sp.]|nr:hypothetical protein [Hydrogenophaga sp.]MDZ4280612.1 hypothetical protein [Hydrogenophaga sp.]
MPTAYRLMFSGDLPPQQRRQRSMVASDVLINAERDQLEDNNH